MASQSRRRLAVTVPISAALVAGLLFLLQFLTVPDLFVDLPGPAEIEILQIIERAPSTPPKFEPEEQPEPPEPLAPTDDVIADAPQVELQTSVTQTETAVTDSVSESNTDSSDVAWLKALDETAKRSDEFDENSASMSPEFDELRRVAKLRYSKPKFEAKKEIWDNVEKDMLGRSILRSGNCFRVLDDPNVGSQDLHREFTQNIVSCSFSFSKRPPKMLPWVDVIVERYEYLQDKDKDINFARGVFGGENDPVTSAESGDDE